MSQDLGTFPVQAGSGLRWTNETGEGRRVELVCPDGTEIIFDWPPGSKFTVFAGTDIKEGSQMNMTVKYLDEDFDGLKLVRNNQKKIKL